MRVLIIGATGAVGRHCVSQALDAGHEVTAAARSPERLDLAHERLTKVHLDLTRPQSIDAAMPGHDAVIAAYGVQISLKDMVGRVTLMEEGTRHVIDAMQRHGVPRLVVLSAAGVGNSRGHTAPLFNYLIQPLILSRVFADKDRQEQAVRESGLAWVIARPGMFTDGPHTGEYCVIQQYEGTNAKTGKISRANVADFLVRSLTSDRHLREAPLLTE